MKKILVYLLALALLGNLTVTGEAARRSVELSCAMETDETVVVTVTLNGETVGDTMGITYTYNDAVLEPVPSRCEWLAAGVLQDFDEFQDQGAWAASDAADLSGGVCVLVFRVLDGEKLDGTRIGCTLLVKNGTRKVAELKGNVTVAVVEEQECDHTYGDWEVNGSIGHIRRCDKCGAGQSQSHTWDAGKVTEDPDRPDQGVKTYTCTVCGGQKTEIVDAGQINTTPSPTVETQPEEEPTRPSTEPTEPQHTEPQHTEPPQEPEDDDPVQDPVQPTDPDGDDPDEEADRPPQGNVEPTVPTEEQLQPTQPGGNENGDETTGDQNGGSSGESGDDHGHEDDGHDHSGTATEPVTGGSQSGGNSSGNDHDHDHDHDHSHDYSTDTGTEDDSDPVADTVATVIIVIALIAAVTVVVLYEYKRSKQQKKTRK